VSAPRAYPWTAVIDALGQPRLEDIKAELVSAHVDASDADAFALVGAVGRALRELVPDEAPAEAVTAYLQLLHHLYLHWAAGHPVHATTRERLSAALAAAAPAPASPPGVWYVQLPERLVWAAPAEGAAHEPVDGLFAAIEAGRARVLAVLGFRPERQGFTTIDATVTLPLAARPRADASAPFSSVLPAGERMGFFSVTTPEEMVWLALLALAGAPG